MLLTSILITASFLFSPTLCFPSYQSPLEDSLANENGPSSNKARENAQHVFNALHAAMRQWDSSLKHNGMSYFSASVPNNTLLYHGRGSKEPVKGMEWLAFEIEHAEMFAGMRGGGGRRPGGGGPGGRNPGEGPPGYGREPPFEPLEAEDEGAHGYLHIYRTTRPLSKLLYIDGMSAGKTTMGTLDTQDFVLGNTSQKEPQRGNGDYSRAEILCGLGAEHGIEGFVRMEAGFEIILCNFTEGMDFVSAFQRPDRDSAAELSEVGQSEYVRGVAARYHGIGGGRVEVDYSSMISAFFYDMNLTNPDHERSELPRLISASKKDRVQIKSDVVSLFSPKRSEHSTIDWQGITDMIVTRYADRLQFLASENLSNSTMLSEINFLLNVYIDYNDPDITNAVEKCTYSYLTPAIPTTISDHLIHTSISTVTHKICTTLFSIRSSLLESSTSSLTTVEQATREIKTLIKYLDWPVWLECGKCAWDEVCFVAIWPWGGVEDHENPGCRKVDELRSRHGYWGGMGGGPPGGGDGRRPPPLEVEDEGGREDL